MFLDFINASLFDFLISNISQFFLRDFPGVFLGQKINIVIPSSQFQHHRRSEKFSLTSAYFHFFCKNRVYPVFTHVFYRNCCKNRVVFLFILQNVNEVFDFDFTFAILKEKTERQIKIKYENCICEG